MAAARGQADAAARQRQAAVVGQRVALLLGRAVVGQQPVVQVTWRRYMTLLFWQTPSVREGCHLLSMPYHALLAASNVLKANAPSVTLRPPQLPLVTVKFLQPTEADIIHAPHVHHAASRITDRMFLGGPNVTCQARRGPVKHMRWL